MFETSMPKILITNTIPRKKRRVQPKVRWKKLWKRIINHGLPKLADLVYIYIYSLVWNNK